MQSGLFVHPLQGTASNGVRLVLHPHGPEPRLAFELTADSCLRHRDSGLYVHPINGRGSNGSLLMFHPEGPDRAFEGEIAFKFEPKASSELSAAVLSAELKVAQAHAAVAQLAASMSDASLSSSSDDDSSEDSSSYGEVTVKDAAVRAVVEQGVAPAAAPVDAAPASPVSPAIQSHQHQQQQQQQKDLEDQLQQQKALEQRRNTLLRLVQEILQTEDDFQANISFAICKPLFFLQDQLVREPLKSGLQECDVELLKCNLQVCVCARECECAYAAAQVQPSGNMPLQLAVPGEAGGRQQPCGHWRAAAVWSRVQKLHTKVPRYIQPLLLKL